MTVAVALLATLAACGGSSHAADPSSPVPITTTPVRSTGTTSASPTLDPNSDAAIIAGVRAWADALTRSARNADLTAIRAAATSRCSCIQGTDQSISYLKANHLHLNVTYSVSAAAVIARARNAATVHAKVTNGPYQALREDGSVFKQEPAAVQTNDYSLKLIGTRWLVDTIL